MSNLTRSNQWTPQFEPLDIIGTGSFGIIRKEGTQLWKDGRARSQTTGRRSNILQNLRGNEHIVKYFERYVDKQNFMLYILMEFKLGDFGLSKAMEMAALLTLMSEIDQWTTVRCQIGYMALGCLIYELCAWHPPFHQAQTQPELAKLIREGKIPNLPRGYSSQLTALIKSMLRQMIPLSERVSLNPPGFTSGSAPSPTPTLNYVHTKRLSMQQKAVDLTMVDASNLTVVGYGSPMKLDTPFKHLAGPTTSEPSVIDWLSLVLLPHHRMVALIPDLLFDKSNLSNEDIQSNVEDGGSGSTNSTNSAEPLLSQNDDKHLHPSSSHHHQPSAQATPTSSTRSPRYNYADPDSLPSPFLKKKSSASTLVSNFLRPTSTLSNPSSTTLTSTTSTTNTAPGSPRKTTGGGGGPARTSSIDTSGISNGMKRIPSMLQHIRTNHLNHPPPLATRPSQISSLTTNKRPSSTNTTTGSNNPSGKPNDSSSHSKKSNLQPSSASSATGSNHLVSKRKDSPIF
ncbi:hypothetical protein H4Q26_004338 [Puccinia striiformis f. sp. tritici PST-130]|nr:hypothetical protein H4Q26_004338 [Puccinia striiformis f. sp. tritici PST-130]